MKIAIVITNLATGGAETMLLKLLQHLDRSRFQPTVISLVGIGEIGPRIAALNIPVYTLDMAPGRIPNLLLVVKLVRLLRALQPDVVHTWLYHADLLGGLAARLAGFNNVIWSIRHSDLSKEKNKRTTLLVVKICALLSSLIPSEIISCSSRAKDIHVAVGYPADKLQVIPNGFDLDRFIPNALARSCLREELGLHADTPLVGLIARYDPQKNHIGFIKAAADVAMKIRSVHFVLAGFHVDNCNNVLTDAIAAQGLQSRFHLLGRRDDTPRLMAALDVLASPSWGEAFPNVLGEAMACGVPCVVTDVGDSAEIVGLTGRVVAVGDMAELARQLIELLRLPQQDKDRLGQQARERVALKYEIKSVAKLYQARYEELIQ